MISHTRQEWFELAVRGLAGQGWQKSQDSLTGSCKYRGLHGRKCAIGHGIPSDADARLWDARTDNGANALVICGILGVNESADTESAARFLVGLQECHDLWGADEPMRPRFLAFSTTHNLVWPADVAVEGEIK